jgi:hypothetical protein
MLVIANGAFKSGSTWQYRILREIVPPKVLPSEYQNSGWVNESIDPKKLREFLDSELYNQSDFVVKNHFSRLNEFRMLSNRPGVVIFDIKRDVRDVLVSAYHHRLNYNSFRGSFGDFFNREAEKVVRGVIRHNELWLSGGSNVYSGEYECLHSNFGKEVYRMGKFIGLELTSGHIDRIKDRTSFSRMKSRGSAFFRKGEVGDWKNYLDEDQIATISKWLVPGARVGNEQ